MERLADDPQHVIDELGYVEYVVVRHSMRGKVAQVLASRRAEGPGAGRARSAGPCRRDARAPGGDVHACDTPDTINQSLDLVLTNGGFGEEARRQVHDDSSRAGDVARLSWPRQGLVEDCADVVGAIGFPVPVLAGSHDKVDPPQDLREHLLPKIPTAGLTELDGLRNRLQRSHGRLDLALARRRGRHHPRGRHQGRLRPDHGGQFDPQDMPERSDRRQRGGPGGIAQPVPPQARCARPGEPTTGWESRLDPSGGRPPNGATRRR
jgi:pimeloyl-ACP methyl ester carboxylesterase